MARHMEAEQRAVCDRYGASFVRPDDALKVGISRGALNGVMPLNGLRHPPENGTTGWYIWGGAELREDEGFFMPVCLHHLREELPAVVPYLALAPGWRFLIAPGCEDVWYDANLLDI